MIWAVNKEPSDRVKDLFEVFHSFIEDNHKGSKEEDIYVR